MATFINSESGLYLNQTLTSNFSLYLSRKHNISLVVRFIDINTAVDLSVLWERQLFPSVCDLMTRLFLFG